MINLVQKFLSYDENIILLKKALDSKNNESKLQINKRFNDYLFKIYFCSYINKCITFRAKNIKNKYKNQREELILNSKNKNYDEDYVNNIPDKSIDYTEKIIAPKSQMDFNNICTDIEVLSAINSLTDKQKEIVYHCCVLEKSEVALAEEMHVTRQAVSKAKNIALKKIRLYLEKLHLKDLN
jgi:DNA-directed RNA polymerase specialized sigma24 family protein